MEQQKKQRKTVQGKVVSTKMDKTVIMEFEVRHIHPIFKKITRKTTRLKVHDEKNECNEGDTIIAEETRPLSSQKRHTLKKIVERAK
ncbi:MAG: 30S ribosomal protein S17 [Leptospiraceae bacterium]|nr:30S ribosomal protein S17 [Leptospiraceae bacterium]MCP5511869.1 30S ribosomal protein S17 [Leptospiraceae bacterium]